MKKALITGIAGFAGSHLAELLVSSGYEVWGFAHPQHSKDNLKTIENKLNLVACDLLNESQVLDFFKNHQPDYIFHLAAFAPTASSVNIPRETIENNILGELNLLEALVSTKSKSKILIIGSIDQYGDVPKKYMPITEDTPFWPTTPYAVSKITQDMLGLQYFLHDNLNIIRLRPSNHIGPRQSKSFVVPSFAAQIAKIEQEGQGIVKVGNLNSWRDFTDVRDMVKAYVSALELGDVGEVYNVGSGNLYKIEDVLGILLSLSKAQIKYVIDKSMVRKIDSTKIEIDFSKFKNETNWEAKIAIEKSLSDTLEYERSQMLNLKK